MSASASGARRAPYGVFALVIGAAIAGAALAGEAQDAMHRGQAALQKDDLPKAVAEFSEAIRLNPKIAAAWAARGWAYSQQDENDKAIADYSEALRLDPKNAETWCNRGHTLSMQGDMEGAVKDLSEALRLDPKLSEAYLSRGWVYSERSEFSKATADYTAAIRLGPVEPHVYYDRALCLSALKRNDEAIADLDLAIARESDNARYFGARGAAQLRKGEYAKGIADLSAAIKLGKTDVGANYEPSSGKELSPEALRHGEEQVRAMLRDRPAMAEHSAETTLLRQWAARKYAGEDLGELIDWDPAPPKDADADNVAPSGGRRARIRIEPLSGAGPQQGKPRTFEELWANAVFELHNVTYCKHFLRFHQEAGAGKLSKEEFVAGIWKYEYLAAQKTRAFYVRVYLPWSQKVKLATEPGLWFAAWWESAEDTLEGFKDKTTYPWRPYSRQYDWSAVNYLYHQLKFKQAMKLLEKMAAEKQYAHDLPTVWLWIGRCHIEMNAPRRAIEALNQSIRLSPTSAEAFRLRGEMYKELGEKAKAEADAAKAKELEGGKK